MFDLLILILHSLVVYLKLSQCQCKSYPVHKESLQECVNPEINQNIDID